MGHDAAISEHDLVLVEVVVSVKELLCLGRLTNSDDAEEIVRRVIRTTLLMTGND